MPFYGKYPYRPINSGKLWKKDAMGQGFGSLYGGNQISDVTNIEDERTIENDNESNFPN